ncbi:MAG: hypothetical protein V7607_2645 [Solirubrobacteraceae bacterium]
MAADRVQERDDPADAVATVSAAKRDVLLWVNRHRLGREDLEDCFSQATLELVTRARSRARAFASDAHIANALEQRFASRIADRQRAIGGRSPIEAAMHAALRRGDSAASDDQDPALARVADPAGDVDARVAARQELRRLRELAEELTDDQRLVLACQVGLGMDSREFCARYDWSIEKYRKVAQRARARLRSLVADYEQGERCRALASELNAHVAGVASARQSERVRRHLANCQACSRTAREIERVVRGAASLLPLPALEDAAHAHHHVGAVGRMLARLLSFWDGGEAAGAAKAGAAGAAAAAGGGAAGGSLAGLGAAKLGVAALCVAGAAGSVAVCDQAGLLHRPSSAHGPASRSAGRDRPASSKRHASTPRATPPSAVRSAAAAAAASTKGSRAAHPAARSSLPTSGAQAGGEFGFEGPGAKDGSSTASRSSSSSSSSRAASAGSSPQSSAGSASTRPSASDTGDGAHAGSEFGFE